MGRMIGDGNRGVVRRGCLVSQRHRLGWECRYVSYLWRRQEHVTVSESMNSSGGETGWEWPFSPHRFGPAELQAARVLIELGLKEDLGERGDVTSNLLIDEHQHGRVAVVARSQGVLSGMPLVALVLAEVDPLCEVSPIRPDGSPVTRGETVAWLSGPIRSLLTAERTLLNFLNHLSGIASLTRLYVAAIEGTSAQVLDTRKTHPGYRLLEKYAVRCGGGCNHRLGLHDGVMIKDNHLAAWRSAHPDSPVTQVIQQVRQVWPELPLTVEVDTLEQLQEMLPGSPDIVLLDNMSLEWLRRAVTLRNEISPQTLLEASGGITLETISAVAATGVDRISVGALTHSAPGFDFGLDWPA